MAKGIIKRYDFRKGFGFIADDDSGEDFFFHKSEWEGDGPIRRGMAVEFLDRDSEKGPQAESVIPLEGGSSNSSTNEKPAVKQVAKKSSIEDRVVSLENSVGTWKIVSFLALTIVVALAVERFFL